MIIIPATVDPLLALPPTLLLKWARGSSGHEGSAEDDEEEVEEVVETCPPVEDDVLDELEAVEPVVDAT